MAALPEQRWQCAEAKTARFGIEARFVVPHASAPGTEREQLAVDVACQRACELERISLSASEQARTTERCWSDVNDAHATHRPDHAG